MESFLRAILTCESQSVLELTLVSLASWCINGADGGAPPRLNESLQRYPSSRGHPPSASSVNDGHTAVHRLLPILWVVTFSLIRTQGVLCWLWHRINMQIHQEEQWQGIIDDSHPKSVFEQSGRVDWR